jgi:hypothetical protein
MSTRIRIVKRSGNQKVGPIPVTYSNAETCPPSCPLKGAGCYAELAFHTAMAWRDDSRFVDWGSFLAWLADLPTGQLWRHNVAGDLPGKGDRLDVKALASLVVAQSGARGYTYTHKPLRTTAERRAVARANAAGFTVNLSADSLVEADSLYARKIGPVAVTVPSDHPQVSKTPAGHTVAVCPAQSKDIDCATCQLCANATRKCIVGFRAHGVSHKKIDNRLRLKVVT